MSGTAPALAGGAAEGSAGDWAERKQPGGEALAKELGYTGPLGGSAEMNIWLHKTVMAKIAANGGKLPTGLA
jgi:hypothetical protein